MCAAAMPVNFIVVDSLKFVHDRQKLAGVMPIAGFVRLAESLQSVDGNLDYGIEGDVDRQDRPMLRLHVSGVLQLQCQRCLDGFEHEVTIKTALRLVAPEALDAAYDDNPDEADCIASSAGLDLAALIEDEVLLALPAYPRHAAGQCAARTSDAGVGSAKILAFSALAALKSK